MSFICICHNNNLLPSKIGFIIHDQVGKKLSGLEWNYMRVKLVFIPKKGRKRTAKHFLLHKQVIQHWATYRWWPDPKDHIISNDPISWFHDRTWLCFSKNGCLLLRYSIKHLVSYHVNLEWNHEQYTLTTLNSKIAKGIMVSTFLNAFKSLSPEEYNHLEAGSFL